MSARLVVLASGTGTNLQALLDACMAPDYGALVVAVGADRSGTGAVERARSAGIDTFELPLGAAASRDEWDGRLTSAVQAYAPDLVVLAGFMRLAGPRFLSRFGERCVNTHPALLPSFPGMHGPRDAIAYGVKISGATLFVVNGGVDSGPIVGQVAVRVYDDDTEASLHERIKQSERAMLVDSVGRMMRDGYTITGRKVTIP